MTGAQLDDPEASGRLLFAIALLAGALLRLVLLGNPDLFGMDEGVWAVSARNLSEAGLSQALTLSATPLGEPSGIPFLFPGLLSFMVNVFGAVEWCIRLPSAFAGLVAAFVLERVVRRGFGQPAGHLAGAFAALFPPLVAGSRAATVETSLVALGLGGVIFGLRAFEEDEPVQGIASGVLFGLGFLANGYAVGLFLAPLLVALAARPSLFALGKTRRTLALLVGSFVLVGGMQLLLTAIFQPALLGFQLKSAFGAAGVLSVTSSSTAFAADLKEIVGTLFLFLPLVGLGVASLARRVDENEILSGATSGERRLSHGALWSAYFFELVVIVAVAGMVRLSSIPVVPALAGLAGVGGAAVLSPGRGARRTLEIRAAAVSGALVLVLAAILMAAPDDPLFGGRRAPMSSAGALAAICVATVGASLFAAGIGARRLAVGFLAALLAAAGVESARRIRHDLLTHRTGSRELADHIAPAVAALPPGQRAFRAPEPEAVAFRLFRTGVSWKGVTSAETVAADAREGIVCWAFRADAPQGRMAPGADVIEWLEAHASEVTPLVDARAGRPTGLRVFVRSP